MILVGDVVQERVNKMKKLTLLIIGLLIIAIVGAGVLYNTREEALDYHTIAKAEREEAMTNMLNTIEYDVPECNILYSGITKCLTLVTYDYTINDITEVKSQMVKVKFDMTKEEVESFITNKIENNLELMYPKEEINYKMFEDDKKTRIDFKEEVEIIK